jgi:AraC family transcriptional regulator of adaptative response / DNA-3-methyladenine glycosylase II
MMLPLPEARICERARLARDPRFDGRFFVAVTTTGIYCRPICPAPTARSANVRYFASAAAAVDAGFRPCLRCRPEAAPGTPAWSGTSAVVTRALRLIGAGALADGGVEPLSARLGIGPRHLHRLFLRHLGASPIDVAQTARIEFAKRLIDETTLSMTEVALSAGFGSVRRFNDAFQRAYGRPPRALRRAAAASGARARPSELRLRLAYRPPFDWEAMIGFLEPRAIAGVERVADGVYRRTIVSGEAAGLLTVRHVPRARSVEVRIDLTDPSALPSIVARVRTMFDLGADPAGVARVLARDPLLAALVRRRPGLRVPGAWDPFETAVRAVVGQQVSVKAAMTIVGRIVSRLGKPVATGEPGLERLFPTPAAIAGDTLDGLGLTRARAATVRRLAAALAEGRLALDSASDAGTIGAQLVAIDGIGPWTAQYIALRGLGDPDAFPAEDLGLRLAAGGGTRVTTRDLRDRAERWRPWRGYAALHLWHSLGDRT